MYLKIKVFGLKNSLRKIIVSNITNHGNIKEEAVLVTGRIANLDVQSVKLN